MASVPQASGSGSGLKSRGEAIVTRADRVQAGLQNLYENDRDSWNKWAQLEHKWKLRGIMIITELATVDDDDEELSLQFKVVRPCRTSSTFAADQWLNAGRWVLDHKINERQDGQLMKVDGGCDTCDYKDCWEKLDLEDNSLFAQSILEIAGDTTTKTARRIFPIVGAKGTSHIKATSNSEGRISGITYSQDRERRNEEYFKKIKDRNAILHALSDNCASLIFNVQKVVLNTASMRNLIIYFALCDETMKDFVQEMDDRVFDTENKRESEVEGRFLIEDTDGQLLLTDTRLSHPVTAPPKQTIDDSIRHVISGVRAWAAIIEAFPSQNLEQARLSIFRCNADTDVEKCGIFALDLALRIQQITSPTYTVDNAKPTLNSLVHNAIPALLGAAYGMDDFKMTDVDDRNVNTLLFKVLDKDDDEKLVDNLMKLGAPLLRLTMNARSYTLKQKGCASLYFTPLNWPIVTLLDLVLTTYGNLCETRKMRSPKTIC
ncbi:hypothetical protein HK101_004618 [Irineochytrium annulatum]|nr:hypothetical protein HK101_004618 [Irineochytrium annulatum]